MKVDDPDDITRLTEDPLIDFAPNWSPDGKFIVYTSASNQEEEEVTDIVTMYAEEGVEKDRYPDDTSSQFSPIWSPDGRSIAYASSEKKGLPEGIYVRGTGHNAVTTKLAEKQGFHRIGKHISWWSGERPGRKCKESDFILPASPMTADFWKAEHLCISVEDYPIGISILGWVILGIVGTIGSGFISYYLRRLFFKNQY